MHVFKDYVVIELWMKLVHELVGKEKGMKQILWRHANKDTHIEISGLDTRTHKICVMIKIIRFGSSVNTQEEINV